MRGRQQPATALSLSWALAQLRAQQEAELGATLGRAGPGAALEPCPPLQPASSDLQLATPTSSDAATSLRGSEGGPPHGAASCSTHHARQLSVHWADALEQHGARQHAPQHAHHTPDKPCLKTQQSSFPFTEEAAAVEGSMQRRPWAAQPAHAAAPGAHKKRSRLAAFGQ